MTLPYALNLYNSVKRGNTRISNITSRAAKWKRSIRRIGGYWLGSFEYQGSRDEMDDLFIDGLMREVRETSGGITNWRGFIGDMEYTRDGIAWRKSMTDVTNSVKIIFTRMFDNLLPNGSAESGAWTVANGYGGTTGAATVTQSTVWVADGTYSCSIVSPGGIEGAAIITSVALVADTAYSFQVQLNVISGSWRIAINKTSDNTKVAAASTKSTTGVQQITLAVAPNTYVGNVRIIITSESVAGTIYGDAAVLQISSQPADTGWVRDTASISEYGRLDNIILEGGLSSAAAQAKATTQLARYGWPRLLPPDSFTENVSSADRLLITCYGYIFTLNWRVCETYGTFGMSTVINTLLSGLDYVSAGVIDTNSVSYTIENRVQLPIWQIFKTIATSGDASGNLWQMGAYADRKLNYTQFPSALSYRFRNGNLYNVAGGLFEPWLAQPGWMQLDDAPIVPGSITLNANDDPRRALIEEVEYQAPNKIQLRSTASG